jgi:hypothetical protein
MRPGSSRISQSSRTASFEENFKNVDSCDMVPP